MTSIDDNGQNGSVNSVAGRPRDRELERRVYDAAIQIYAREGWPGFTFAAVARAAAVGKAALYLRWEGPGQLLQETLAVRWFPLDGIDTGSFRGDLTQLALTWFDLLTGPNAGVLLHLQADNRTNNEAQPYTSAYGTELIESGRLIGQRAIERGEIAPDLDVKLLKDLVVGGVNARIYSTPRGELTRLIQDRDNFVAKLMDIVLPGDD